MQKIVLLCIGSLKQEWLKTGIAEYATRLSHECDFEIVELPASKEKDPERQKTDESDRLLDAIMKRDADVYVLDERGKALQSAALADALQSARDDGKTLIFVIGGAYGFDDRVRARAHTVLSLGPMVLPHGFPRLFILEQLYRGLQISKGTGYHHE